MATATVGINFKIVDGENGFKRLIMDADGLRRAMESTVRVTEQLNHKALNFATVCAGFKSAAGALSQLQGAVQSLVDESGKFSTAMKASNTMAGKGTEDFDKLKASVTGLAKEIPITRELLANGLYQTISNGVPEDNWIDFLRTSARSAVGGIADLEKVVGVTATMIKNYGLSWEEAGAIQDKIQLTAKNGVTSFEQLAAALPRVTGNAATLGVSINELMATFATLTGVSGNTAEVSTQLAAIFSALVKPSSEATKMAAEMGIQFDAAAIKAAGGLQGFLRALDESVKQYAASSGVLEQEVYGKLFGSAESLRALVPLQGELAESFNSNVATMVNSAGTMDAAFADMASTGEATTQLLKNKWAEFTDLISAGAGKIAPVLNFAAPVLNSAASLAILAGSLKTVNFWQHTVALSTKTLTAVKVLWRTVTLKCSDGMKVLTLAMGNATLTANLLKVALRGLLIATGVGAAVWAVCEVVSLLSTSADKAAVSTQRLTEAQERAKQRSEELRQAEESEEKAKQETIAQLDIYKAKLKEFKGSKEDEKKLVEELNGAYGQTMGYFSSVSDWYKALIANSEAYCKQMVLEGKTRRWANQIIAIDDDIDAIAGKPGKRKFYSKERKLVLDKAYLMTPEARQQYLDKGDYIYEDGKIWQKSDHDRAQEAVTKLVKEKVNIQKEFDDGIKELSGMKMTVEGVKNPLTVNPATPDKTDSKKSKGNTAASKERKLVENPTTKEELQTNVELTRKKLDTLKLTGDDTEEQRALLRNVKIWEDQLDAIKMTEAAYSRPATLDTLQRIGEELQYQQELRQRSSSEFIAGIDKEIARLEELQQSIEDAAFTPLAKEDIKTFQEIDRQLAHYNDLLSRATTDDREQIQKEINSLEELREEWQHALAELRKPADIPALRSLAEVEKALSYWRDVQSRAGAEQRADIQRTIHTLEKRSEVLNRGVELADLQRDVAEIEKLTGRDYRIKVKAMDVDTITEQIRELQRMLADTENPVTDSQREQIESLIGSYARFRKEATDMPELIGSAWGEVQNLQGAVSSLTSAFGENATMWERLTGVVDGFIQAAGAIKEIVALVNTLTAATEGLTAAKAAEAAATGVATGAKVVETGVAEGATAAKSGEAVASAAASASELPFPANLIALATTMAQLMPVLSFAGSFATGGVVGGASPSGDKLWARVNSGEMILNPRQQRRLFAMLNGTQPIRGVSAPQLTVVQPRMPDLSAHLRDPQTGVGGDVRFTIEGSKLVGVLANATRIGAKSGRKTNIII